jgi:hypothetical protein
MTMALLFGYAAMKLLAVTSGRSTGTSWMAFSFCRMKTCVMTRSPGPRLASPMGAALVLASASGTIFTKPSPSTAA